MNNHLNSVQKELFQIKLLFEQMELIIEAMKRRRRVSWKP